MTYLQHDDASTTNGCMFRLTNQRKKGFLNLFDDAPSVVGQSMNDQQIKARKKWGNGEIVYQDGWSHHGLVQIVTRQSDGVQMAVWWSETTDYRFDM